MPEKSSGEVLIEAKGLHVCFGRQPILENIDVEVRSNEILTLIGPNGAGKTTLIRVLLGLLKPDAGDIKRRERLVVGYLPQSFEIDPSLPISVRRLLSLTQKPSDEQIRQTLEEAGAGYLLDHPLQSLSGGERQRVLLARALVRDPDLLVLDEPIQNVDVTGQFELYNLITRIRERRGCGIIMISHDLHLVMASTNRVLCLNHHICCSGHPEDVSRHPEYLALFGAQAAGNLAVYTHSHDHAHDLEGHVVPMPGGKPHGAHPKSEA